MLVSSLAVGWPMLVAGDVGKTLLFNGAVGGSRLDQIAARFFGPIFTWGGVPGNILIAEGIYNDLIQGANVATCFARWQTMIAQYRAAGYAKIVWLAVMSATGSPYVDTNYETYRLAINVLIANSGLVDRIVNFDGVTVPRNDDLLHPNDAGQQVMRPLIAAAVNLLM